MAEEKKGFRWFRRDKQEAGRAEGPTGTQEQQEARSAEGATGTEEQAARTAEGATEPQDQSAHGADQDQTRGEEARSADRDEHTRGEEGRRPDREEKNPTRGEATSWINRLRAGLSRSSGAIGTGIAALFTHRKLDAATLEELEDLLIQSDFGVETAAKIADAIGETRRERNISPEEIRAVLAAEVEAALAPVARPLEIDPDRKPHVILLVGVNGTGKTTTIGKLAAKFRADGLKVVLAAGDTFRAAAIDQLKIWGERTGSAVVARAPGADPAGLAFDALAEAKAEGADVLLIDTAGRLQNRAELMAELEKVVRVLKKQDPDAPHTVLLTLDATTGQNAMSQVEIFGRQAGVTGLVMTKLDGTARGGILVAIAAKTGLPVHFIGVGEGVDDLEPFRAADFARAIAGLE